MWIRLRGLTLGLFMIVSILVAMPALAGAQDGATSWAESYPIRGDVVIPAGADVALDTHVRLDSLIVEGTLRCADRPVQLRARTIEIRGRFLCGTPDTPFRRHLTITLTGPGTAGADGGHMGLGDKYLVVTDGGELALHGIRRRTWTTLARPAQPGDTVIELAEPIGWRRDKIVLAPTNFEPDQAEVATIVSRQGRTVTLAEPLQYEHWCGTDTFGDRSITECGEVGVLSHRITIQGDPQSDDTGIGGHAMFLEGSRVHIEGVQFRRMGQRGVLARYPVHWHHAHHADGSIAFSSIWNSYNRFVTIHGTHGIQVSRVVGYDTIGHGYYLEDGIETGNEFRLNLAVGVRSAEEHEALVPSDTDASGFWISNPDNTYVANRVAGADFAGFWMAFPEHPRGMSATQDVSPVRTPLRRFAANTAHSVGFAGLFIDKGENPDRTVSTTWYQPRVDSSDPDSRQVTPTIASFTVWKSRHYGIWVRTFSGINITRATIADTWRAVYLANVPKAPDKTKFGVLRNSLVVGTSSNKGTPESWEKVDVNGHTLPKPWEPDADITGVSFYDGPMAVYDTVFAGFTSNATRDAGALGTQTPNPFSISTRNEVRGLEFVNAERVLFPDLGEGRQGDAGVMLVDRDGSVTGEAGSAVVAAGSLLDGPDCDARQDWSASVCGGSHGRIFVTREDGAHLRMDVTRDDGRTVYLAAEEGWRDSIALNVRADRFHTIDVEGSDPDAWSFWSGAEIPTGVGLIIAVPAPSGSWDVELWGTNRGRVDSLGDLESGEAGWFFDTATGLIHLRLTADARGGAID